METNIAKVKKVTSETVPGATREQIVKKLGGYPKAKKVEEIDKVNTPRSQGRAPGAVGV